MGHDGHNGCHGIRHALGGDGDLLPESTDVIMASIGKRPRITPCQPDDVAAALVG